MSVINLPTRIILTAQGDKDRWSLIALSAALKLYSPSSALTDASGAKIRKIFKCGKVKADRLFELAIKSDLFTFKNGTLTARRYSRLYGYIGQFNSKNGTHTYEKSICMSAVQFKNFAKKTELKLRDIEKELRLIAIQLGIFIKQRAEKTSIILGEDSSCSFASLYVNTLTTISGRSKSTLYRYCKDLIDSRKIEKKVHGAKCEQDERGRIYIKQEPSEYRLISFDMVSRIKHIIYNHIGRKRILSEKTSKNFGKTKYDYFD